MKKFLKGAAAATLALSLSGCFKLRMNINVKSDATYNGSYTFMLSESMLTMDGSDIDTSLQSLLESVKKDNPDIEAEIVKEGEGDDAYGGILVKGLPENTVKTTKDDNVITVEIQIKDMQNAIEGETNTSSAGFTPEMFKEYGGEAVIIVDMPGAPETNAGKIEDNRVTVDLLEEDVETLIIKCKAGLSRAQIIGVSCAGALALVLILFFIFKKKK